jgi:hypothetical protein
MNFKFTIDDFLNDFAAGFIFLFGLVITNYKILLPKIEYLSHIKDFNIFYSICVLIMVYIIGLAISAISNFLDQDFYLLIDGLIRKTYKKNAEKFSYILINIFINKPLFFIKKITFDLCF